MEPGKTGGGAERLAQHFRPQAASAHTEQDDIVEAIMPNGFGKRSHVGCLGLHVPGHGQPAQPIRDFGGVGLPQVVIFFPQPLEETMLSHVGQRSVDLSLEAGITR